MKKIFNYTIALLSVLFLASCVTQGIDFSSDIGWVKKGQTTQSDVKLLLNEPHSVGSSGGVKTWTYGYYKYRAFSKSNTKELKFYWNPDGTVQNFSFNSSFPEDTKIKK